MFASNANTFLQINAKRYLRPATKRAIRYRVRENMTLVLCMASILLLQVQGATEESSSDHDVPRPVASSKPIRELAFMALLATMFSGVNAQFPEDELNKVQDMYGALYQAYQDPLNPEPKIKGSIDVAKYDTGNVWEDKLIFSIMRPFEHLTRSLQNAVARRFQDKEGKLISTGNFPVDLIVDNITNMDDKNMRGMIIHNALIEPEVAGLEGIVKEVIGTNLKRYKGENKILTLHENKTKLNKILQRFCKQHYFKRVLDIVEARFGTPILRDHRAMNLYQIDHGGRDMKNDEGAKCHQDQGQFQWIIHFVLDDQGENFDGGDFRMIIGGECGKDIFPEVSVSPQRGHVIVHRDDTRHQVAPTRLVDEDGKPIFAEGRRRTYIVGGVFRGDKEHNQREIKRIERIKRDLERNARKINGLPDEERSRVRQAAQADKRGINEDRRRGKGKPRK